MGEREFLYNIGNASLFRIRDKLLGYRYILVDGQKERLFDSEKEVWEFDKNRYTETQKVM